MFPVICLYQTSVCVTKTSKRGKLEQIFKSNSIVRELNSRSFRE